MRKIILIIMTIIVWSNYSLARPNFNPSGSSMGSQHPTPPPVHIQQPAKYFNKLTAELVYGALEIKKLAKDPVWIVRDRLQFKYKNFTGYICEFSSEKAINEAQEETLNANNEEHPTWSIVQDNIILVLDGRLSEEEFLEFQKVLRSMN